MKNFTKAIAIISALVILCSSLAACTSNETTTSTEPLTKDNYATITATETVEATPEVETNENQIAKETLTKFFTSETEEEIKKYLTEDSYHNAAALLQAYPGTNYSVATEKAGTFDKYDVFELSLTNNETNISSTSFVLLEKQGDSYLLCNNENVFSKLYEDASCKHCNGAGNITSGGNTCSICGGTGQQYIPNAYYDNTMNMWMGQHQACSGCGGAGKIGSTTSTCSGCNGKGFIFR